MTAQELALDILLILSIAENSLEEAAKSWEGEAILIEAMEKIVELCQEEANKL